MCMGLSSFNLVSLLRKFGIIITIALQMYYTCMYVRLFGIYTCVEDHAKLYYICWRFMRNIYVKLAMGYCTFNLQICANLAIWPP